MLGQGCLGSSPPDQVRLPISTTRCSSSTERRGGACPAIAPAAITNVHHQDHQCAALPLLRNHPRGQSRRQGCRRAGRSPQPPTPDQPWRPRLPGANYVGGRRPPDRLGPGSRAGRPPGLPAAPAAAAGSRPSALAAAAEPAAVRGSGRGHPEDAVIPADGVHWLLALAWEKVVAAWGSLWCAWRLRG